MKRLFWIHPALAMSLVVHVAAAAVVVSGHGLARAAQSPAEDSTTLDVEAPPLPAETPVEVPRAEEPEHVSSAPASPPTHHHDYPVAPDHDARPHDPSQVHVPLPSQASPSPSPAPSPEPAAAPAVAEAPSDAPVRFTLAKGSAATTLGATSTGASATAAGGAGASTTGDPNGAGPILAEAAVSVPARLLASVPATYPPAARQAEIEADVPVEIVLDERGAVVSARPVATSGFGLDDAATRTVRAYRFSPAVKDGHPVRVRMRWTVQFRLR